MKLEVGLPSIYIRDGNYKYNFEKDEVIKICLYFDDFIEKANENNNKFLRNISCNYYEFSGEIVSIRKVYRPTLVVINTGDLKFYSVKSPNVNFEIGDIVTGKGKLNFDPYFWFESLYEQPNVIDIYNVYKIVGIQALKYSEEIFENGKLVQRSSEKPTVKEIFSTYPLSYDFLTDFIFTLEKQEDSLKNIIPYSSID